MDESLPCRSLRIAADKIFGLQSESCCLVSILFDAGLAHYPAGGNLGDKSLAPHGMVNYSEFKWPTVDDSGRHFCVLFRREVDP